MSDVGEKLIAAVRELVLEQPDYVYERPPHPSLTSGTRCVYVHDGAPSCLIGHAAWKLGLIDASIEGTDDNSLGSSELIHVLDLEVEGYEEHWLAEVQDQQDTGTAWGQAVANADASEYVPEEDDDDE